MFTPASLLQNRYQIIRQLGAGGMGAVYLALDRISGQNVAIKESVSTDPATIAQFQTEAQILALIDHRNLPRVSGFFSVAAGPQYLVMEYVEGQNLEAAVQQCGALSETDALKWMFQIFDAVKYLHSHHVIHRDINPRNIILTPDGEAVLVDFGIAKIALPDTGTRLGARGMGSPGYAPPEQYSGGTDERSDVYALGATLYYTLTARAPAESTLRTARKALLVSPRRINSAVSLDIEKAVLTAMKLDVWKRFDSVESLELALTSSSAQGSTRLISRPVVSEQRAVISTPVPRVVSHRNAFPILAFGATILIGGTLLALLFALLITVSGSAVSGRQTKTAMQAVGAPEAISADASTAIPLVVPMAEPSASNIDFQKRLDPVTGIAYDDAGHPFQGAIAVDVATCANGTQNRIFLTSGFVSSAVWSPDGSKVLVSFWGVPYGPDRYDVRVLRLLNADGSDGSDVAKSDPHGGDRLRGFVDAIWSPDGQTLAFLREDFGNSCVYTMAVTGAGLRRLDKCQADDDPRYWSVDGKWIVVKAHRGGFYALKADGSQHLPLDGIGSIQLYDERYYPWKVIGSPSCNGADFWDCD